MHAQTLRLLYYSDRNYQGIWTDNRSKIMYIVFNMFITFFLNQLNYLSSLKT
jgi:hypothetical protein